ncbi:MAG: group 1 truncated hemoglobin [Betaproteobacteria bacterium]|nr:group 1 truncated hemoglobin [Betaproteobacteria bacterium]
MLKKFGTLFALAGLVATGTLLALQAHAQEGVKRPDSAAYQAFGEKAGLTRVMDDFMVGLLADPRTKPFFENADQARVKAQLVDQFCFILGGPCEYKGAKMKPMHANLGINREQFNALVEQLQNAMDKHKVPFRAQNQLLAILAPMHRDIVTQ